MPKKQHSILSPSSSQRWLNCDKYISFLSDEDLKQQKYLEQDNPMRGRGSQMHEIMHYWVMSRMYLNGIADKPSSKDDELCHAALETIQKKLCDFDDAESIFAEERLFYSSEFFGTPDLIIVTKEKIYIIDYKFGLTPLANLSFNQLKCYAFLFSNDPRYKKHAVGKDFGLVYVKPFWVNNEPRCQFASTEMSSYSVESMRDRIESRIELLNGKQGERGYPLTRLENISKQCINCKYKELCLLTKKNLAFLKIDFNDETSPEVLEEAYILNQVFEKSRERYIGTLKSSESNGDEDAKKELESLKSKNLCVIKERALPRVWDEEKLKKYQESLGSDVDKLYLDKSLSFDEACEKYGKDYIESFFDKKAGYSIIEDKQED